jgi:Protein of unknown function (DUF3300)
MRSILASTLLMTLGATAYGGPPHSPILATSASFATFEQPLFAPDQLDQLVAPIALYPDSLLTQIFMGATYPLEIVQAARWRSKSPSLSGAQLESALTELDWDPSIKVLCGFPDVLANLSDNLDWTQDLGDAVLGQQADLLAAVQRMRKIAFVNDQLKSTEQLLIVEQSPTVIVIESADPEVIYVPTYSPTVVYPTWVMPMPYYPALYAPAVAGFGAMAFTAGAAWGASNWGDCDWNGGDIDIDVDRYNEFNSKTTNNYNSNNTVNNKSGNAAVSDRANNKTNFQHDPSRRGGVNYRNSSTANKYGGAGTNQRISQDTARGKVSSQPKSGTGPSASLPKSGSGGASAGVGGASDRTARTPSASTSNRTSPSGSGASGSGNRTSKSGGGFSGSSNSKLDRSSSQRGSSSRGTKSYGGSGSGSKGRSSGGGGGRRR